LVERVGTGLDCGALSLGAGAGEESWGSVFCELKGMLIEGMRVESAGGREARKRVGVRAGTAGEN
jgi:hypothetical protein